MKVELNITGTAQACSSPEGQSNRRPLRGAPVELRTIK